MASLFERAPGEPKTPEITLSFLLGDIATPNTQEALFFKAWGLLTLPSTSRLYEALLVYRYLGQPLTSMNDMNTKNYFIS